MKYVVLAEFRATADRIAEFGAYMDRHAALSREEPGCLVFDVCQDPDDEAVFLFYEVYTDEEAYLAHRAMPYHERFFRLGGAVLEKTGDTLFVSRRVFARRDEFEGEVNWEE